MRPSYRRHIKMVQVCNRQLHSVSSPLGSSPNIAGAISAGGGIGFTARSDASASGMLTLTGSLAYGLQPVQQADSKMISLDASSVNSVYTTALEPQIPATLCLVAIRY